MNEWIFYISFHFRVSCWILYYSDGLPEEEIVCGSTGESEGEDVKAKILKNEKRVSFRPKHNGVK